MGIFENVKIALEGLRLNKMRTFLTMLGIIIGISSVIAIITVGDSLSKSVSKGFDNLASNLIQFSVQPKKDSGVDWGELNSRDYFPVELIEQVKDRFGTRIQAIEITGSGPSGEIKSGRTSVKVNVSSTSPGGKETNKVKMINGRFLEELDISQNKEVAVISDKVLEKIFDNKVQNAIGSQIDVKSEGNVIRTYTVVGVYEYVPVSFGMMGGENPDSPTILYIPYTVGNRQYAPKDKDISKLSSFFITGTDREDNDALKDDIENFFNNGFYKNNTRVELKAMTLASQISEINNIMDTLKLAIGGIAAISLLVGGIGVMNILLVSVTERTREIGIRKALGATNTDIQGQFIIESIIICIIGGAIGVLLGGVGGYAMSSIMKSPTLPSILAIVIAVGFSMFIGVFFGYYPASKAAKLNPIDALRHE
ncbi:MAG: FtsX-like permease family protein [Tissierellia bacterium]|nr:FtsX-like permease family protein [Tissierellia bacterium]